MPNHRYWCNRPARKCPTLTTATTTALTINALRLRLRKSPPCPAGITPRTCTMRASTLCACNVRTFGRPTRISCNCFAIGSANISPSRLCRCRRSDSASIGRYSVTNANAQSACVRCVSTIAGSTPPKRSHWPKSATRCAVLSVRRLCRCHRQSSSTAAAAATCRTPICAHCLCISWSARIAVCRTTLPTGWTISVWSSCARFVRHR